MNKNNFGLYKGNILFYTRGGSFAANAWIENGNCDGIAGTSFPAFTADDRGHYNIGRYNVSPVSEEKLKELLETAHPIFKLILKIEDMFENRKNNGFRVRADYSMAISLIKELVEEHGETEVLNYFDEILNQ